MIFSKEYLDLCGIKTFHYDWNDISVSCLARPPGTYSMMWHRRVYYQEYLWKESYFFPLSSKWNFSLFTQSVVSLSFHLTCLFRFSHQWDMSSGRLGEEIKRIISNKQQDLLPLNLRAFPRVIAKVTGLLFWPRICGLGSREGEILISQKYVKGRRKRGREKKITCREHEYQGRHA